MTTDAVFDFAELLSLDGMRETQVFRGGATAIYPDGTVDLRYEGLPQGALHAATEWLVANRVILRDAEVAGVKLDGTWRTVAIQEQLVMEGGRKTGTVLVQRFAKGLYDALDWRVCRVHQGNYALGNTQSADSTSGTTSALYRRWHTLRMPYVRPDKAKELADSIVDVSWTDLVVGGVKHEGIWFNLGATWVLEEDQTASVLITIAQPIFTVKGYRNNDTFDGEDRYLVANVPSQNVQDVLDAWKSGRKGADGMVESFHQDRNTANIILTVPVPMAKSGQRVRMTEDAFKTVVATTDINQDTAGTLPAAEVGKVYSTDTEETALGKHNVTQTVDTAKAAEVAEHNVSVLANGTTIKEHTIRHVDPSNMPAWAEAPSSHVEGTATVIRRTLNEYGGYAIERRDRVVTEVRRPATSGTFYSYDRGAGTVYAYEYDGVSPANLSSRLNELAAYKATHTINSSFEFDEATGTFSVRVTATPGGGGSSGGGAKACEIEWTEREIQEDRTYYKPAGMLIVWKRAVDYACGRIQDTSEDDVKAYLSDAKASAGDEEFDAHVGPLGRWGFFGEYRYVKSRGSWVKEEFYSYG